MFPVHISIYVHNTFSVEKSLVPCCRFLYLKIVGKNPCESVYTTTLEPKNNLTLFWSPVKSYVFVYLLSSSETRTIPSHGPHINVASTMKISTVRSAYISLYVASLIQMQHAFNSWALYAARAIGKLKVDCTWILLSRPHMNCGLELHGVVQFVLHGENNKWYKIVILWRIMVV